MPNNVLYSAEDQGFRIEVGIDENPMNPRDWDNFGTMICFHRKYCLGDAKKKYQDGWTPENWEKKILEIQRQGGIVMPLYLYDHSGITMSLGNFRHVDSQGWDWGQVGWILCTREQIDKEFDGDRKRAEAMLEAEVETYDQYLRGDVYGYVVEKIEKCPTCGEQKTEVVESCSGFFGYDFKTNGMLENIPSEFKPLLEAALEKGCKG